MATFKVIPDKRYKRKDGSHRYCLRATVNGKVHYLQLNFTLSEQQHKLVFVKKAMTREYINFREQISDLETKAERIYTSMRVFDFNRFKVLFYSKEEVENEDDPELPETLAIKELFDYYIKHADIKHATKTYLNVAKNLFEQFQPNLYVDDITIKFLKKFEKNQLNQSKSISTASSYLRNLRTILNYFRNVKKIIPSDYKYPFGQGGYSLKSIRKKKMVLSDDEIQKVIELDEFDSWKQEYARDIWMVLYYGSGINPIDLLRLRWKNVEENYIHLIRKKTETTRKSTIQELTLPLTDELKYYLNKVADPTSPFVLGKIKESYSEITLFNRKNRFRQEINTELKKIRQKLNLSAPLLMGTARDCYASTLNRKGVPREFIANMLGHHDPRTTSHYLDSLSIEGTFDVNKNLVKRKTQQTGVVDLDEMYWN